MAQKTMRQFLMEKVDNFRAFLKELPLTDEQLTSVYKMDLMPQAMFAYELQQVLTEVYDKREEMVRRMLDLLAATRKDEPLGIMLWYADMIKTIAELDKEGGPPKEKHVDPIETLTPILEKSTVEQRLKMIRYLELFLKLLLPHAYKTCTEGGTQALAAAVEEPLK